jgi:hypothetical protein
VPPVNQPFTVLCIRKVDKVEEGEELCNHAYHRLPQPHTPPASLSLAHHWPESVPHAGATSHTRSEGRERERVGGEGETPVAVVDLRGGERERALQETY